MNSYELTDIEKETLYLIATKQQTVFCGGKSKTTKKYLRNQATYTLESHKLITRKHIGGYNHCTATEEAIELAKGFKHVCKVSRRQIERQQTRQNGKYSEYETCDKCGKKHSMDDLAYDEDFGGVVCSKCATNW